MKKAIFLLGLFTSTILLGQLPTNNLEAYYPFNGDANDETNNTHNGVVNGAVLTTDRFGNLNSAYSFDGIDDYIELVAAANVFGTQPNEWSYSLWVKLEGNTPSVYYCALSDYNDYAGFDKTFSTLCEFQGGKGYAHVYTREAGATVYEVDSANYADSTWKHVVVTFSKQEENMKIYSNGNLVKTAAIDTSINGFSDNSVKLQIGKRPLIRNSNSYPFDGDIDDVRFYSRAITQCEVSNLYHEENKITRVVVEDTLNIYLSSLITTVYEAESAFASINIYPNPASGTLTIDIDNFSELSNVSIKVMDALSNEVHNEMVSSATQTINVNDWSTGLYFIYVLNGKSIVDVRKIVVKK